MLKLNGIDIPSFVKVNKVEFSILPTIKNNTLSVRGRKGVYLFGQEIGERKISVDVTIHSLPNQVMLQTRDLAEWLYHEEAVKLVIADEPEKYYMVVPDGDTNISEVVSIGQGKITFLCTEPFAYGLDRVYENNTIVGTEPFYFDVDGTAETFPTIELSVKEDISNITVVADDGAVMIGEPVEITKTPTNPLPVRLWDEMTNVASWTSALKVDDGLIMGDFASTGYDFIQAGADFGTHSAWHGASKVKSLATPLQDFQVDSYITLNSSQGQLGRVSIYMLDANNEFVGKMELADAWGNNKSMVWFAIAGGGNYNGKQIHRTENHAGIWHNFSGLLKIGRRGKHWYCSIHKQKAGGGYTSEMYKTWDDTKNLFTNKQVAKVQVHIGAYGTKPPATMKVSDIKVMERVELTSAQVPIIAESGDKFTIDCSKAIIYKNDLPYYEGLNPISKFFSLKKGLNGLAITPAKADIKVTYTERWL